MSPPSTSTSPVWILPDAGEHAQQGRLADAVRADQADHLLRGNVEADIVERDGLAVALRDVAQPSRPSASSSVTSITWRRSQPVGFQRLLGNRL